MPDSSWDQQSWVDIIPPAEATTIEPIYIALFAVVTIIAGIVVYIINKPKNRTRIKLNFIYRKFLHDKLTSKQACIEILYLLHGARNTKQISEIILTDNSHTNYWAPYLERLYRYSYSTLLPDKKETLQLFQETNKWLKNL